MVKKAVEKTMRSSPSLRPGDNVESSVEQIAPGLSRSWLLNKRIVVFRLSSSSRSVADAWVECVKETMEHWPKGQPYLAIHDLTSDKVSLTPYARKRAEELIPLSAGAPGYAALLLSPTFVAHLIRLFLRAQRQQGNENQIFFNMTDAVKWLNRKAAEFKLPTP